MLLVERVDGGDHLVASRLARQFGFKLSESPLNFLAHNARRNTFAASDFRVALGECLHPVGRSCRMVAIHVKTMRLLPTFLKRHADGVSRLGRTVMQGWLRDERSLMP